MRVPTGQASSPEEAPPTPGPPAPMVVPGQGQHLGPQSSDRAGEDWS